MRRRWGASWGWRRGRGASLSLVQGHGCPDEPLQRRLVDLLALVEVDGAPCVSLEARVEETRRVLQRRPFGEGHLQDALVGLARADDAVVRPHRHPSPLPLLDDVGVGFLHERTETAEHLAPPVAPLLDPRVDQLRWRPALRRPALLHTVSPCDRYAFRATAGRGACRRDKRLQTCARGRPLLGRSRVAEATMRQSG